MFRDHIEDVSSPLGEANTELSDHELAVLLRISGYDADVVRQFRRTIFAAERWRRERGPKDTLASALGRALENCDSDLQT